MMHHLKLVEQLYIGLLLLAASCCCLRRVVQQALRAAF